VALLASSVVLLQAALRAMLLNVILIANAVVTTTGAKLAIIGMTVMAIAFTKNGAPTSATIVAMIETTAASL
jgi:hypothetical protein